MAAVSAEFDRAIIIRMLGHKLFDVIVEVLADPDFFGIDLPEYDAVNPCTTFFSAISRDATAMKNVLDFTEDGTPYKSLIRSVVIPTLFAFRDSPNDEVTLFMLYITFCEMASVGGGDYFAYANLLGHSTFLFVGRYSRMYWSSVVDAFKKDCSEASGACHRLIKFAGSTLRIRTFLPIDGILPSYAVEDNSITVKENVLDIFDAEDYRFLSFIFSTYSAFPLVSPENDERRKRLVRG